MRISILSISQENLADDTEVDDSPSAFGYTGYMKTYAMILLVLVCTLSLGPGLNAQDIELAQAGDNVPAFEFTRIVMNSRGRYARDDFVGRPILFELWGFR